MLRLSNDEDAAWITPACNDSEIARFIGLPSPYTEADARSFLARVARGWTTGTEAVFVVANATDSEPLGLVELHVDAGDPARASLGYWVRVEARGHGVATLAVRIVARWAFEELGVCRLELTTAPDNIASQRVAERAGFTREGILRGWMPTPNGRRDSVMFSLLATDLADVR